MERDAAAEQRDSTAEQRDGAARRRDTSADELTCVVAVTASAMVGDRERIVAAGFGGYIQKPIDPGTFMGTLERFLPPSTTLASVGS